MNKALLVGVTTGNNRIDDAGGTLDEWRQFLQARQFTVEPPAGCVESLPVILDRLENWLVAGSVPGDVLVLVVCAHGTNKLGEDYFNPIEFRREIAESQTDALWEKLDAGVRVYYVSEACRDSVSFLAEGRWFELWMRKLLRPVWRVFAFKPGKLSATDVIKLKGCQIGRPCHYDTDGHKGDFSMALIAEAAVTPTPKTSVAMSAATKTVFRRGNGQEPDPTIPEDRPIFT